MNKISKKQLLIGIAILAIPGSTFIAGPYYLYKYLKKPKKKPPTIEEFIQSLRDEVKEEEQNEQ